MNGWDEILHNDNTRRNRYVHTWKWRGGTLLSSCRKEGNLRVTYQVRNVQCSISISIRDADSARLDVDRDSVAYLRGTCVRSSRSFSAQEVGGCCGAVRCGAVRKTHMWSRSFHFFSPHLVWKWPVRRIIGLVLQIPIRMYVCICIREVALEPAGIKFRRDPRKKTKLLCWFGLVRFWWLMASALPGGRYPLVRTEDTCRVGLCGRRWSCLYEAVPRCEMWVREGRLGVVMGTGPCGAVRIDGLTTWLIDWLIKCGDVPRYHWWNRFRRCDGKCEILARGAYGMLCCWFGF